MQLLPLPGTDLQVSELALGTAAFGTSLRGGDADRLLAQYLEAGGTFLDTAHCYAFWLEGGSGASERELGASLRRLGAWDRVVVATKGGHPAQGAAYPRPDDFLAPEVLASDVGESLERLGRDRIDLYYLHRDDGRTPVGEIIEALNGQIRQGRLRYLGASNWSVARIAEANSYARERGLQGFVVSQIQGSLAVPTWSTGPDPTTRRLGQEELEWHSGTGVPLVCYSATAGGYFSGAGKQNQLYDTPENAARRTRAHALAGEMGCTPTQIALAWLRAQPATVIPLFSTVNAEHLTEALGATQIRLSLEQSRWLRDG
jgi:aryl-alcohol dehydrogenase-like predicted oxidoreductase